MYTAYTQLQRAVMHLAGVNATLVSHAERNWQSATFHGSRHAMTISFEDNDSRARFAAALPDHQFHVRGYLVADANVAEARHAPDCELVIEVLLLADDTPC